MKVFLKPKIFGITLIELIIVLGILSLVIGGAFSIFLFGNNTYKAGTKQYDLQSDIRILSISISESLKYAADVEILSGAYDPNDFGDPSNAVYKNYIGYDYIYLEFSGTDGVAVKKLKYDSSRNVYNTITLASRNSPNMIFNLDFSNGGSKLLAYSLKAIDGGKKFEANTKVAIMNSHLGHLSMGGTGHAIRYKASDVLVHVNTPPTAAPVTITGIAKEGQVLTGDYYYYDADSDAEAGTTFKWYRKAEASTTWNEIGGATGKSYTLTSADVGMVVCFEVTPRAATGAITGLPEKSNQTQKVVNATANMPPQVKDIIITGALIKNNTITATYTYYDSENDIEGNSIYAWYKCDNEDGTGNITLLKNDTKSYKVKPGDENGYIFFTVQPVAKTGASPGALTRSAVIGPVKK